MRAEETLVQAAVGQPCERRPPVSQLLHRDGRLLCEQRHHGRVGEVIALPPGVGEVLLPAILRVHGAKRRVDAARGEHRVCVLATALANDDDFYAGCVCSDGGA